MAQPPSKTTLIWEDQGGGIHINFSFGDVKRFYKQDGIKISVTDADGERIVLDKKIIEFLRSHYNQNPESFLAITGFGNDNETQMQKNAVVLNQLRDPIIYPEDMAFLLRRFGEGTVDEDMTMEKWKEVISEANPEIVKAQLGDSELKDFKKAMERDEGWWVVFAKPKSLQTYSVDDLNPIEIEIYLGLLNQYSPISFPPAFITKSDPTHFWCFQIGLFGRYPVNRLPYWVDVFKLRRDSFYPWKGMFMKLVVSLEEGEKAKNVNWFMWTMASIDLLMQCMEVAFFIAFDPVQPLLDFVGRGVTKLGTVTLNLIGKVAPAFEYALKSAFQLIIRMLNKIKTVAMYGGSKLASTLNIAMKAVLNQPQIFETFFLRARSFMAMFGISVSPKMADTIALSYQYLSQNRQFFASWIQGFFKNATQRASENVFVQKFFAFTGGDGSASGIQKIVENVAMHTSIQSMEFMRKYLAEKSDNEELLKELHTIEHGYETAVDIAASLGNFQEIANKYKLGFNKFTVVYMIITSVIVHFSQYRDEEGKSVIGDVTSIKQDPVLSKIFARYQEPDFNEEDFQMMLQVVTVIDLVTFENGVVDKMTFTPEQVKALLIDSDPKNRQWTDEQIKYFVDIKEKVFSLIYQNMLSDFTRIMNQFHNAGHAQYILSSYSLFFSYWEYLRMYYVLLEKWQKQKDFVPVLIFTNVKDFEKGENVKAWFDMFMQNNDHIFTGFQGLQDYLTPSSEFYFLKSS